MPTRNIKPITKPKLRLYYPQLQNETGHEFIGRTKNFALNQVTTQKPLQYNKT